MCGVGFFSGRCVRNAAPGHTRYRSGSDWQRGGGRRSRPLVEFVQNVTACSRLTLASPGSTSTN